MNDIRAQNLFGLNSNFGTKSATVQTVKTVAVANGNTGAVIASKSDEDVINYSQGAQYCGANLRSDLDTLLTHFGQVTTDGLFAILPTSINVQFNAAQYPDITITGHNHATLPHSAMVNYSNVAGLFPASGFGVPDFGITTGDSSPTNATLSVTIDHHDVKNADGTHLHGENTMNVSGELSASFVGVPTTETEAGIETEVKAYFAANGLTVNHFMVISVDKNTTNESFQSFAFDAQLFV